MGQKPATPEMQKGQMVLKAVSALQSMSVPELHDQWRSLFCSEPPSCRPTLLVRRLAHRIQELAYGRSMDEVRRRIEEKRVALGLDGMGFKSARCGNRQADMPVIGTRLIREWNGVTWEVTVGTNGFEFQGKTYRSLTAVATAITGTHWNGRAFFGLSKARKGGKA